MAHFAELDENDIVQRVIVVANFELLVDGVENEIKGIEFCQSLFGGNWVQTSYNGTFRKNYAGIGYTYNESIDAFVSPKCHEEALLDESICQWNCNNSDHTLEVPNE
jgi:hypothetical protein